MQNRVNLLAQDRVNQWCWARNVLKKWLAGPGDDPKILAFAQLESERKRTSWLTVFRMRPSLFSGFVFP
jgi:hypothetical protein